MLDLAFIDYLEIFSGVSLLWVSVYSVSKNPYLKISWIVFAFLAGLGISNLTNPVLVYTPSFNEYVTWQKITDWPLFLAPVFCFHASLLIRSKKNLTAKYLLILGYVQAIFFYAADIHKGLVLNENITRFTDFRRLDGFSPGILLVPSVVIACLYFIFALIVFLKETKKGLTEYLLLAISSFSFVLIGILTFISFYVIIPAADVIFNISFPLAALIFIYSMMKYRVFAPGEKNIFDSTFWYRTIAIMLIISVYLISFKLSGLALTFYSFVFLEILVVITLFSHSFYDWLSTFINDLIYNPSKGFSVVNDEEIYNVLKNFHQPERLESSPLMRLKILNNKLKNDKDVTPVDALQALIKESIEHFRPKVEESRRIKQNLKYQLLRMLVFDDAEEGQILWELGFEYYPVKIMSQERKYRAPLFEVGSPADYTYTSRNAFLALKKEAIHDITWRMSYLEKLSKKN